MSDNTTAKIPLVETISELVENQGLFVSNGYSDVQVTVMENNEQVRKILRLPIRSVSLDEQIRNETEPPRPPVIEKLIKADSESGRMLGMSEDGLVMVFDPTDRAYVEAVEAHGRENAWRKAISAINIPWKNADGSTAETYEEKRAVLRSNGIHFDHIIKICTDVNRLTAWNEERADFLSGG